MKKEKFTIVSNNQISKELFQLELSGQLPVIRAGQFVNIEIPKFYLRRPISICDWNEETLTLIYKVVGKGTKQLSEIRPGHKLDLLIPLGNGFDIEKTTDKTVLCGGGVGVPPLLGLTKEMLKAGKTPTVLLGFNREEDIFAIEKFRELGINPIITTADGSLGIKGFVTDALNNIDFDYICACGPEAMLKALGSFVKSGGQFSFEARMACGFGACMGCSCKTKFGSKRICKDGPVLFYEDIIW